MTALADAAMGQLRDGVHRRRRPRPGARHGRLHARPVPLPRPPHAGAAAPGRRRARASSRRPTEADVVAFTTACWAMPEREYQYAGCDYAIRHVLALRPRLPRPRPHAAHHQELVGHRRRARPPTSSVRSCGPIPPWSPSWTTGSTTTTTGWCAPPSSISSTPRTAPTPTRLFGYCSRRAGDREFFVRKAIGWALREYSKTDADAVVAFVATHHELSPLSAREALKWLQRKERV